MKIAQQQVGKVRMPFTNKINKEILNYQINPQLFWVGELDPELNVFDIELVTEYGTSYNSYLFKTKKNNFVLFDTVLVSFFDDYLEKIKSIVKDLSKIKYVVINHTEPDHMGCIEDLMAYLTNAKIIVSTEALKYLVEITNHNDFSTIDATKNPLITLDGEKIHFLQVPMLHWPDSMFTYIEGLKTLVTCDVFGSHYAFKDLVISKMSQKEYKTHFFDTLLYCYTKIFEPFKSFVIDAIKKISDFDIQLMLPGHGPILDDHNKIKEIIQYYYDWSLDISPYEDNLVAVVHCSNDQKTKLIINHIVTGIKVVLPKIIIKSHFLSNRNYHNNKEVIFKDLYFANGILFISDAQIIDAPELIWKLLIHLNPITHGKLQKVTSVFDINQNQVATNNILERINQLKMEFLDCFYNDIKQTDDKFKWVNFGTKFAKFLEKKVKT